MDTIRKNLRRISALTTTATLLVAASLIALAPDDTPSGAAICLATAAIIILIINRIISGKTTRAIKKTLAKQTERNKAENTTIEDVIDPKEKNGSEEDKAQKLANLVDQFDKLGDPKEIASAFLTRMAKEFEIVQGLFYVKTDGEEPKFELLADYAFYGEERPRPFAVGEGLNGQAARDQSPLYLSSLPQNYREIVSGLGRRQPNHLAIIPLVNEGQTVAVVEMSLFRDLGRSPLLQLERILNGISRHFAK